MTKVAEAKSATQRPDRAGPEPPRKNAAGQATRLRIIDAAEKLFADRGIDAVSLKEIRAACGLSNSSATQYHFGSKSALIEVIRGARAAEVAQRRSVILEALKREGRRQDVRRLLEVYFRPKVEMIDGDDRNTYAKFSMEYRIRYDNVDKDKHPYVETLSRWTTEAKALLLAALPLPPQVTDFRLRALINMLDAALVERDTLRGRREGVPSRESLLQWLLDMGVSALAAPVPE